jgi:hypothetical protein
MKIFTLPRLAAELGVSYATILRLRNEKFLTPTQCNGSREYYTIEDYCRAAALSVQAHRNTTLASKQDRKAQTTTGKTLDYHSIFQPYLK